MRKQRGKENRQRNAFNGNLWVMELREALAPPTLAQKLGTVPHVSSLLHRITRLSGCPLDQVGEWLLKTAISRGARHYTRDFPLALPEDAGDVTDEEIGVGLCLGVHTYQSVYLRAAAQLLSSPRIDIESLQRLAVLERAEAVLLHIAAAAERVAPDMEPWSEIRRRLGRGASILKDELPHWSRFVSQTGVTAFGGGPEIKWLTRSELNR